MARTVVVMKSQHPYLEDKGRNPYFDHSKFALHTLPDSLAVRKEAKKVDPGI
jgi:hypothetical protein